jgi:hypothetical protein
MHLQVKMMMFPGNSSVPVVSNLSQNQIQVKHMRDHHVGSRKCLGFQHSEMYGMKEKP